MSETNGYTYVVAFDYRQDGHDNGPKLVGPFNTRGAAESWLSRQRYDYEASVSPVAWHDMYLPSQPLDPTHGNADSDRAGGAS